VARALAVKADVLLMDEPLSNLDALLRMQMRSELKALLREVGTTTIYVTHDQAEALSMGDRVAVMRSGEIAQIDSPLTVYDSPANTYVGGFIGTPPMSFLEAEVSRNGAGQVIKVSGGAFHVSPPVAPLEAGRKVLLGIRAEAIKVHTSPHENAITAQVVVTETLGSHNLVTVRSGQDTLKVSTAPNLYLAPNSRVWLEFAPDRMRWMDSVTGDAVAHADQAPEAWVS
jgi:multiple sugar transport system ATP-binding protein